MIRFLSLFSGIECATLAWEPLGWEPVAFAEVEPFPCAVLASRWPNVPNLGDISRIADAQVRALGRIDLVVGGFPCQDLSVAGKRKGLIDGETGEKTRSGLFYDAMRIARASGARFLLLENVPGLYSNNGGEDFAAVVAEILGCSFSVPKGGWRNTGCAASERGLLEWCTLDAQWFGVPQRRRRFFALFDSGDWWSRPPILVEPESLFRDYPTREIQGKGAPTLPSRRTGGGGLGTDVDLDGGLIQAFGGNNTAGPIDVAARLGCNESGSGYRLDFESDTLIAHALRADGFDASEDGTGRGVPLVPVQSVPLRGREGGGAAELSGDVATALRASQGGGDKPHVLAPVAVNPYQRTISDVTSPCSAGDSKRMAGGVLAPVAFRHVASASDTGTPQADLAPSLRGADDTGMAIAFDTTQITHPENRCRPEPGDPCHPLATGAHHPALATSMQVRRLTPRECERLQGLPDDYTRIPVRTFLRQPKTRHFLRYRDLYEPNPDGTWTRFAADGPRYKAIGNGMARPPMEWIGRRIDGVWRMIQGVEMMEPRACGLMEVGK